MIELFLTIFILTLEIMKICPLAYGLLTLSNYFLMPCVDNVELDRYYDDPSVPKLLKSDIYHCYP